ncbi:MAG: tRNA pseudouridine(55) synthase TruB, partial [Alteromonadales bacterium]|nr:tRNA pseudouridine(55) synthase TruB [Alteromonadales bacterium]
YEKMVTIEQLDALIEQAKEQDISPYELLDPLLLKMDTAVKNYPEVNITEEMGDFVLHGQPVQVFGAPDDTLVRITVGEKHTFIGMGEMNDDGLIAPKRLVNL